MMSGKRPKDMTVDELMALRVVVQTYSELDRVIWFNDDDIVAFVDVEGQRWTLKQTHKGEWVRVETCW